jgi:site-specific recombinase XerD
VAIRLEDLPAAFRRHLRAAARAPRTVELYSKGVRYSSRWLAELAENAEPATVSTRLRGMRRFYRWLVAEGEPDVAPSSHCVIARLVSSGFSCWIQ